MGGKSGRAPGKVGPRREGQERVWMIMKSGRTESAAKWGSTGDAEPVGECGPSGNESP